MGPALIPAVTVMQIYPFLEDRDLNLAEQFKSDDVLKSYNCCENIHVCFVCVVSDKEHGVLKDMWTGRKAWREMDSRPYSHSMNTNWCPEVHD